VKKQKYETITSKRCITLYSCCFPLIAAKMPRPDGDPCDGDGTCGCPDGEDSHDWDDR